MTTAICHPEKPMRARGYCNSCYSNIVVRGRQTNGRNYQHTNATRLEAAIARWGDPYKAEQQTGMPFGDLLAAWKRIEEANGTKPARPDRRLSPCGTYAAYKRHHRRGETPCEPCKTAHAVESQARRRRAVERAS